MVAAATVTTPSTSIPTASTKSVKKPKAREPGASFTGDDAPVVRAACIYFIAKDTGRVLFTQRAKGKSFPGHWCASAGGKIEPGETPEQGAIREAKEEIDYDGDADERDLVRIGFSKPRGKSSIALTSFLCRLKTEFTPDCDPREVAGYVWALPQDAPTPLHPAVKDVLHRLVPKGSFNDLTQDAGYKLTHEQAGYLGPAQRLPTTSGRCANCKAFERVGSCKKVEGPIETNGWCKVGVGKADGKRYDPEGPNIERKYALLVHDAGGSFVGDRGDRDIPAFDAIEWEEGDHPRDKGGKFTSGGGGEGAAPRKRDEADSAAIESYTYKGDRYTNAIARGTDDWLTDEQRAIGEKTLAGMKRAFETAKPLDKDTTFFRGLRSSQDIDKLQLGQYVGKSFVDKGFASTTEHEIVAKSFSSEHKGNKLHPEQRVDYSNSIMMKVNVPTGTKVLVPGKDGFYGKDEGEHILPPGGRFVVRKIDTSRSDDKPSVMHVDYMPPDDYTAEPVGEFKDTDNEPTGPTKAQIMKQNYRKWLQENGEKAQQERLAKIPGTPEYYAAKGQGKSGAKPAQGKRNEERPKARPKAEPEELTGSSSNFNMSHLQEHWSQQQKKAEKKSKKGSFFGGLFGGDAGGSFKEDDHPRNEGGQFTSGAGASGASSPHAEKQAAAAKKHGFEPSGENSYTSKETGANLKITPSSNPHAPASWKITTTSGNVIRGTSASKGLEALAKHSKFHPVGDIAAGTVKFSEYSSDLPKELNDVPFNTFKPPEDWNTVAGINHKLDETPLERIKGKPYTDEDGKQQKASDKLPASGVVIREPDGRVWVVKPTGGFGGYEQTFPKGKVDEGLSPQANAIKECWEESGLHVRITGLVGDFEGDTSIARYYTAERIGGNPTQHGWESERVILAEQKDLPKLLNRGRDKAIASKAGFAMPQHKAKDDAMGVSEYTYDADWKEGEHPRDEKGQFTSGGGAPLKMSELKKVGSQLGSNEGGQYEDKDGNKFYVKKLKSPEHVKNEMLAAGLFNLAGSNTLNYRPVEGGTHIASEWQKMPKNNVSQFDAEERGEMQDDFAVHAWTANWDAAGLSGDNQSVNAEGQVVSNDLGGALMYRAQGSPKGNAFGNSVDEWDTLRSKSKNAQSAAVFGSMTEKQLKQSASRVARVPDQAIRDEVKKNGLPDSLADKLIARKKDIAKRAGVQTIEETGGGSFKSGSANGSKTSPEEFNKQAAASAAAQQKQKVLEKRQDILDGIANVKKEIETGVSIFGDKLTPDQIEARKLMELPFHQHQLKEFDKANGTSEADTPKAGPPTQYEKDMHSAAWQMSGADDNLRIALESVPSLNKYIGSIEKGDKPIEKLPSAINLVAQHVMMMKKKFMSSSPNSKFEADRKLHDLVEATAKLYAASKDVAAAKTAAADVESKLNELAKIRDVKPNSYEEPAPAKGGGSFTSEKTPKKAAKKAPAKPVEEKKKQAAAKTAAKPETLSAGSPAASYGIKKGLAGKAKKLGFVKQSMSRTGKIKLEHENGSVLVVEPPKEGNESSTYTFYKPDGSKITGTTGVTGKSFYEKVGAAIGHSFK